MAPNDGTALGQSPYWNACSGLAPRAKGFLSIGIGGFKSLAEKLCQVANTVKGKGDHPGKGLEPTMTTANSAQSKLGIVRITLRTIRVGQSNQRGAMVRAAPTDNTIEMMMASRVETRAICTVSSRPSSVRSRMDQSGGKN